jgi:hypothetical protein
LKADSVTTELRSNLFLFVLLFMTIIILSSKNSFGQDINNRTKENKWFIELPLRFTQLQNTNTMLSGIKLGKALTNRVSVSLSVYHSFYLKSFKAKANLPGFDEQPRLFINGVGTELDYKLYEHNNFSICAQALIGWGFMTYDLDRDHFKSTHVNYVALEPAIISYYKLNHSTALGIGISYRPILGEKDFNFSSDLWNGAFPVNRNFPNGINIKINLKGYL